MEAKIRMSFIEVARLVREGSTHESVVHFCFTPGERGVRASLRLFFGPNDVPEPRLGASGVSLLHQLELQHRGIERRSRLRGRAVLPRGLPMRRHDVHGRMRQRRVFIVLEYRGNQRHRVHCVQLAVLEDESFGKLRDLFVDRDLPRVTPWVPGCSRAVGTSGRRRRAPRRCR
jgi:hypothetical protein